MKNTVFFILTFVAIALIYVILFSSYDSEDRSARSKVKPWEVDAKAPGVEKKIPTH